MSDFKVGELIVSSKPYAYALSNEFRGQFCDCCFKENEDLKRCSQCSFLYFCNKNCQAKAWEFHKKECKLIKKAGSKNPTASLRLMAQIIFKIKKYGQENPYEEVHGRKISFSTLMSHAEDVKKDLKRCQLMMAMLITLKEYIGADNLPSPAEFTEIFGKMCINSFSIFHEMSTIGSGLYLGASIFDHSCDPDAVVTFNGVELNVRMIKNVPHRNINKVYISYIEELMVKEERQEKLMEQYYFTCMCSCCLSSENEVLKTKLLDDSPEAKRQAIKCQEELDIIKEMMTDKKDPANIKDACMKLLKVQDKIMGDYNLCKLRTLEIMFDMCIHLKAWVDALSLTPQIIKSLRLYLGNHHPFLGLYLFKEGKILHLQELSRVAVPSLTEAENILKITHGELHPSTQDLQNLLQEATFASEHSSSSLT